MSLLLSTSERERYVKGTAVACHAHGQAAAAEDGEHRLILGKYLAVEARDACVACDPDQMLQDQGGDAETTMGGACHESNLRRA
jgi:hypothetical protein